MFKPTNPKFDTLMTELRQSREKKRNIDDEIRELPWNVSEIDDLEKMVTKIDEEIAALIKRKEANIKEIAELQSKESDSLGTHIKEMESEVKDIANTDFKSFINTMTEENTTIKYLYADTPTTRIMDEFANDNDKDFLVLRNVFWEKDLVVAKKHSYIESANVDAPTMTELKTYRSRSSTPERMKPLLEEIRKYDCSDMKSGTKVQFDKPLPLGAQTYANQTGYGWQWDWSNGYGDYTEGTYYGEVTTFLIIGFIYQGK